MAVRRVCSHCKSVLASEDLHRCARCKTAYYCNEDCQKAAWKAGHKDYCSPLVTPTAITKTLFHSQIGTNAKAMHMLEALSTLVPPYDAKNAPQDRKYLASTMFRGDDFCVTAIFFNIVNELKNPASNAGGNFAEHLRKKADDTSFFHVYADGKTNDSNCALCRRTLNPQQVAQVLSEVFSQDVERLAFVSGNLGFELALDTGTWKKIYKYKA